MADFAFLVHPLFPFAGRLFGLRTMHPHLVWNPDSKSPDDTGIICEIGYRNVTGVVVGVPLLPQTLLEDQQATLFAMERAVQIAAPIRQVGLGGLLSVVAGRGTALAEACGLPVTIGNAATAWAASTLALKIAEGRRVAVLGGKGPVGKAVAGLLREEGLDVTLDPQDVRPYPVVVGAHTSGGVLPPEALASGTTLIDVALPRTLTGPPPPGVKVIKGESLGLPPDWKRDGWGHIFHVIAGYGHGSVYACVIEPLVAIAAGRTEPFSIGRNLPVANVRAFGKLAEELGFAPEVRALS